MPGHHVDITFFPDAPGTVFKPDAGPAIHQGDATARAYTVSVQPGSKFGLVDGLLLVDGGKKNGGARISLLSPRSQALYRQPQPPRSLQVEPEPRMAD